MMMWEHSFSFFYRIYIWIFPFFSYMLVHSFLSIIYIEMCASIRVCISFVLFSLFSSFIFLLSLVVYNKLELTLLTNTYKIKAQIFKI